jgi:hypothetical protein
MARGRRLNDEVKWIIAEVYNAHPDWPAKMIKHAVNKRLGQPKWPALSTVQKELRKHKDSLGSENSQERPWNTDAVYNYPEYAISLEKLPIVLEVWKSCIEKGTWLTIREAKWISLLSFKITDMEELVETAKRYALVEKLYNMIGHPFNSRGLDKRLMNLQLDCSDPFEPLAADLPPFIDKDGEVIDFTKPDAKDRFEAKRKPNKAEIEEPRQEIEHEKDNAAKGVKNERKHKAKREK